MAVLGLCIKIFCARIVDVSIGTVRTMLVVKGKTLIAAIAAFIEVLIWFVVAREALNTDMNSIFIPIAYAGGYATGTFLGSILANKFIDGVVGVQVIISRQNGEIIEELRTAGYAVSVIPLEDAKDDDNRHMLFIQINKKKLKGLTRLINKFDKDAFIVINDTKYVYNGFIK